MILQGKSPLESKIARQEDAISKWANNKGIGTFHHCPRFGKLYEGVEICKRVINKNNNAKILIVVPSDIIAQQWITLLHREVGHVYDYTVMTLFKLSRVFSQVFIDYYTLVVVDEIHKFATSSVASHIDLIISKSKFRLGLLGILPKSEYIDIIESFAPIIDVISDREAISNKWIADYIEYNVPLVLSEEDKVRYSKFTTPIRALMTQFKDSHKLFLVNGEPVFKNEMEVIIACYSGKKMLGRYVSSAKIRNVLAALYGWTVDIDLNVDANVKIDNEWNPVNLYESAKYFKQAVDSRNEILNNNDVKLKAVLEIMEYFNDRQGIIFNESIPFTERLTDSLNAINIKSVAYHSAIKSRPLINPSTGNYYKLIKKDKVKIFGKSKIKEYAKQGLDAKYFRCLVTVKSLDEGFTAQGISLVITTSGTTNPIQYGQRVARGSTISTDNPDKVTKVVNLYFDDFILPDGYKIHSRDKIKLKKRQTYSKDVIYLQKLTDLFEIN